MEIRRSSRGKGGYGNDDLKVKSDSIQVWDDDVDDNLKVKSDSIRALMQIEAGKHFLVGVFFTFWLSRFHKSEKNCTFHSKN